MCSRYECVYDDVLKMYRHMEFSSNGHLFKKWKTIVEPYGEKKNGSFIQMYESGEKHIHCNYLDDKLDGTYKIWNKKGELIHENQFIKGKKNGVCKKWSKNILFVICEYVDGKLHGSYIEFYQNGSLNTMCEYKNGLLSGEKKVWYPVVNGLYETPTDIKDCLDMFNHLEKGQLYVKINFLDGKMNGEYLKYNKKGDLIKSCFILNV